MCVLQVVDGVFIALGARKVDVEGKLGVRFAGNKEKASGVAAHPFNEVAQRDVRACTLAHLHLLVVHDDLEHLVQKVLRERLRDGDPQRGSRGLKADAHFVGKGTEGRVSGWEPPGGKPGP